MTALNKRAKIRTLHIKLLCNMLKVKHGCFPPWKFNLMCLSSKWLELTYLVGRNMTYDIVLGLGKALAVGNCRDGLCEKKPEASLMAGTAGSC